MDGDTIDLHGQFVEEAEDILEARIKYAQSQGQTHLHVYARPTGAQKSQTNKEG